MNILSIIYSIPAMPYTTSTLITNTVTDSAISISPTTTSPSPDNSPHIPPLNYTQHVQEVSQQYSIDIPNHRKDPDKPDAVHLDESVLRGAPGPSKLTSNQHPYSVQYDPMSKTQPTSARMSMSFHRKTRAGSTLPPQSPPPASSLPQAPVEALSDPSTPTTKRADSQRHPGEQENLDVTRHRRTPSGLMALEEENDLPNSPEKQVKDEPSYIYPRRESPPLPPLPILSSTPETNAQSRTMPLSKPSSPLLANIANVITPRPRGTSLQTRNELTSVPNTNPATNGAVAQRKNPGSARSSSPADSTTSAVSVPYPIPSVSTMPTNSSFSVRSRSSSQPGRRPSIVGGQITVEERPPLPIVGVRNGTPRKASVPTKMNYNGPPLQIDSNLLQTTFASYTGNLPTTPVSPLPPAPPSDPLLKPYHMMNLLRTTMTSLTGGYVTRRLHVPFEVWSQGGAKLTNLDEKIHVVNILCDALEDLQTSSSDCFGAGNVCSGLALGIGSIGRKEAETWLSKLEEFSSVCVGVVSRFGKKLGVGEGFVSRKTTLGDKITRRLDKFTNGKK